MAELFREMMNFILAILGILVPAVLLFWGFMYWRERRRSAQYKVIWKRASALDPAEIMEIRAREDHGFKAYYFERPEHGQIVQHIREGHHVLVTGNPLAEVEDKPANCRRAAKAFGEALRVYSEKKYPEVFRVVIGNLRRLAGFCGEDVVKEALNGE